MFSLYGIWSVFFHPLFLSRPNKVYLKKQPLDSVISVRQAAPDWWRQEAVPRIWEPICGHAHSMFEHRSPTRSRCMTPFHISKTAGKRHMKLDK